MTKKTTPKAKAKAAKTAAPRKEYSPELAEKVLALYVSGMPLEEIETLPEMPARRDVFRWKRQNSEFAAEYEDARNLVGDGAVDTAQSIARKAIAGEIEPRDARDIVDMLFRVAGALNPRRYAQKFERSELNVTSNHLHISVSDTSQWIAKMLGTGAALPPPEPLQE